MILLLLCLICFVHSKPILKTIDFATENFPKNEMVEKKGSEELIGGESLVFQIPINQGGAYLGYSLEITQSKGWGQNVDPKFDLYLFDESQFRVYSSGDQSMGLSSLRFNRNLRFVDDGDIFLDKKALKVGNVGENYYLVVDNTALFASSLAGAPSAAPPLSSSVSVNYNVHLKVFPQPYSSGFCDTRFVHSHDRSVLLAFEADLDQYISWDAQCLRGDDRDDGTCEVEMVFVPQNLHAQALAGEPVVVDTTPFNDDGIQTQIRSEDQRVFGFRLKRNHNLDSFAMIRFGLAGSVRETGCLVEPFPRLAEKPAFGVLSEQNTAQAVVVQSAIGDIVVAQLTADPNVIKPTASLAVSVAHARQASAFGYTGADLSDKYQASVIVVNVQLFSDVSRATEPLARELWAGSGTLAIRLNDPANLDDLCLARLDEQGEAMASAQAQATGGGRDVIVDKVWPCVAASGVVSADSAIPATVVEAAMTNSGFRSDSRLVQFAIQEPGVYVVLKSDELSDVPIFLRDEYKYYFIAAGAAILLAVCAIMFCVCCVCTGKRDGFMSHEAANELAYGDDAVELEGRASYSLVPVDEKKARKLNAKPQY